MKVFLQREEIRNDGNYSLGTLEIKMNHSAKFQTTSKLLKNLSINDSSWISLFLEVR